MTPEREQEIKAEEREQIEPEIDPDKLEQQGLEKLYRNQSGIK